MQEKGIKRLVTKQLKKKFPHWHRLSKKEKKKLAKQVLEEVISSYRFNEKVNVPLFELTGTPALPAGIISLNKMESKTELAFVQQYGVTVITPPKKSVKLPENVDPDTHAVYMNEWCEVPIDYMGRTDKGHEFRCGDESKGCPCSYSCLKYREIPMDAGLFGQIPDQVDEVELVRELHKHIERTYNLLKHREGLESLRVRSQHGVMAVSTFAHMSTLLLEIVGTRKSKSKKVSEQHKLAFAA